MNPTIADMLKEKHREESADVPVLARVSADGLCACHRPVKSVTVLYSPSVNGNPHHKKSDRPPHRAFHT